MQWEKKVRGATHCRTTVAELASAAPSLTCCWIARTATSSASLLLMLCLLLCLCEMLVYILNGLELAAEEVTQCLQALKSKVSESGIIAVCANGRERVPQLDGRKHMFCW